LDDPALTFGLESLDLLGYKINYDTIINKVICFLCFTDFLSELSFLGNLFFEEASCLNGLPSILFGDCFRAFGFESSWWAHKEDSSNWWFLEHLDKIIEGFVWLGDQQLL